VEYQALSGAQSVDDVPLEPTMDDVGWFAACAPGYVNLAKTMMVRGGGVRWSRRRRSRIFMWNCRPTCICVP
jgi:hypothetical protein